MADNANPTITPEGQNVPAGGVVPPPANNAGGAGVIPGIPAAAGTQTPLNTLGQAVTMEQLNAHINQAIEHGLAERVKLVLSQTNIEEVDGDIVAQVGVVAPPGTTEERARALYSARGEQFKVGFDITSSEERSKG